MLTFTFIRCERSVISSRWPRLLAAGAILAGAACAQIGLGLAPMREELNLSAGATHSAVLMLSNSGLHKVRVMAEMLDFYLDATATPQFGPRYPQEAEFSCRDWLVANPMEIELNGKAQTPVRYTLRVPAKANDRSYHCAIGFTTQPTAEELKSSAIGLRTAVQIVAAVYVVVGKPDVKGGLEDLKLEYTGGEAGAPQWRAVVTFRNDGLMHFRPVGELNVLNAQGTVVETARFAPLPVLPKREQRFLFPVKLAGGGQYTLQARVDTGGEEIQEATAHVDTAALVAAAKARP